MSKIGGWQELTQRSDNGCSGVAEGPQNRQFSSKRYFFQM